MTTPNRPLSLVRKSMAALANVYLAGLLGWLALYLVFGDRWPWLFALNTFAVYLFAPLPLALLIGVAARRRETWVMGAVAAVAWALLFGRLFLPRILAAQAGGPGLRVLTTNILAFNTDTGAVIASLRASNADLIAIQELSPQVASAIRQELGGEYPYQVLAPHPGYTGGGVISRYPLQPTGESLPGYWLGPPQVLRVDFEGRPVTFVRFHAPSGLDRVAEREAAARALADFAASHPGPLIMAGDLNATGLGPTHRLITRELHDAWETAGHGLGHTFPGANSPGSSRPSLAGIPVPKWLIRIDYVFYSDALTAISAQTGPWDGVSDHRPVLVELALK